MDNRSTMPNSHGFFGRLQTVRRVDARDFTIPGGASHLRYPMGSSRLVYNPSYSLFWNRAMNQTLALVFLVSTMTTVSGQEQPDPRAWLEDVTNPKALSWVKER